MGRKRVKIEEKKRGGEEEGTNRRAQNLPINKKNMSNPNSLMEAFNVRPRICNPLECRDNLNIRNTLTNLITLSIAKDMA
mgnify:CR=1 FL=1